jgi:hypothetical protein
MLFNNDAVFPEFPAEFPFDMKDRLILSDSSISVHLKSFVLIDAIGLRDRRLRHRLWIGESFWYNVDEDVDLLNPWRMRGWYLDLDSPLSISEQKLHFWSLLRMHADSCLHSPFFEVTEYHGMGLGLRSKVDRWVEEIAEEIPGYLEFISHALFDALHHFGHKSLYSFKDVDGIQHWCILYGPLSLVNSNRNVPVGFLHCDPVNHEEELFFEFNFSIAHSTIVMYAGEEDEMVISDRYPQITVTPFDRTNHAWYSHVRYSSNHHPAPPLTRLNTMKELVARVKMSWKGRDNDRSDRRRIMYADQIYIDYPWDDANNVGQPINSVVDPMEVEVVDLTNDDDE